MHAFAMMSYFIEPLSLPPTGFYSSFEALLGTAQTHAASASYASTMSHSTKKDIRVIKALSCRRGDRDFKTTVNR